VTLGVAKGRQEAAIPGLTTELAKVGITVRTGQIPAFPGSTDQVTFIDFRQTAIASSKTRSEVNDAVLTIQQNDVGHTENIRMARRGAASVSDACRA
jgi:hypothetical protein